MLDCSVILIMIIIPHLIQIYFLVSVQNGSIHQKDAVNDDDFEPYLSSQTNQVSLIVSYLGNLAYISIT